MQENRHSTSCPYALPPEWSPTRQFLREPTGSRTHFPTNAERIVDHGEALCFCASSGTHLQRSWCKAPAHSRSPHVPCPGCPRTGVLLLATILADFSSLHAICVRAVASTACIDGVSMQPAFNPPGHTYACARTKFPSCSNVCLL